MKTLTLKDIQRIIKEFEGSNLTELELEFKEIKLRLSKNKETQIINTVQEEKLNNNGHTKIKEEENNTIIEAPIILPVSSILSPLVGTFYESATPGLDPFVTVGQRVKKGDIVCIIEAMKIMNEITSDVDGIIEKINFKNGEVVGFNDEIITVKSNANNIE